MTVAPGTTAPGVSFTTPLMVVAAPSNKEVINAHNIMLLHRVKGIDYRTVQILRDVGAGRLASPRRRGILRSRPEDCRKAEKPSVLAVTNAVCTPRHIRGAHTR